MFPFECKMYLLFGSVFLAGGSFLTGWVCAKACKCLTVTVQKTD